ncbi:MAG TPA: MBL fold metallo-hydrolase [Candidatus Sumerlaeota bacterium]|nr:MBL fold metallo-hydrolase [Candidatus Sumerlaeota bacterium]HRS00902.1 MBL fold metallo-hydrolase [Candidatus Sumerlaeia bacterium]HON50556.1 MBL fold metallo-hydrolase [Candidatus Sumerlaeota bacterium]HOR65378.1 MBL fold metallo-hydrolase [Candidatus Sumerlaeota bacterium]HPL74816.1 MBL fold metallo-hydrolase [Candidatus Sumerlaeota bacterium]
MAETKSPLSVLVLGIGDFFSRKYYHTSMVLLAESRPIFVDCPDPLPKMLHEASRKSGINLSLSDVDNVILTHLHGDHANGLESLGFYSKFMRHKKPTLHTIPEAADVIWDNRLKASMGPLVDGDFVPCGEMCLEDFFRIRILKPGKWFNVSGVKIKIHYSKHFIPCFGFKAFFKGRRFGYSSDTVFDPAHIEFLSDCDLIIHETNKGGHTEYEKLLMLPEEIKQKMMLIHVRDDFNARTSKIRVAREGGLYQV